MTLKHTVINDGNILISPTASKATSGSINGHCNEGQAKSAVLHRSLHEDPLRVVSAKGNILYLGNGQKIFDASGGAAVACLGHGNERVQKAVQEQMGNVSYCHSLFYGTEAAEELADLLIDSTYGEMARVFIVSSGSEAIEAAIKLARQYHLEKKPSEKQRIHFIARQQSYHGTTLGALGVGGHVARRKIYEPMLTRDSSLVSPCYRYRGLDYTTETLSSYVQRLEEELDAEFQRIGPDRVAAFVAEPVVGAALGCVPSVKGYFQAIRRVCDKYGALLIMDEVMCGGGRVGPEPTDRYPQPIHAWQDPSVGVVPDIQAMGKGLGAGYMPAAAMLVGHKVVDALRNGSGAFMHGQTYQGHPVACRAALEVQRIIRDEDLVANVRKQGALLGRLLQRRVASHAHVGDVRGQGLFWGIEFVRDKVNKEPFEASGGIATGVFELARQEPFNISLYPGNGSVDGVRGDHVIIAPAYNVTEEEVQHLADITAAVIEEFFAGVKDGK